MMKTINKLMLVGLLAISGALNAAQPVNPDLPAQIILGYVQDANFQSGLQTGVGLGGHQPDSSAAKSSDHNPVTAGLSEGIKQLIGATIIVGGGTYVLKRLASYVTGENDEEKVTKELTNLTAELTLLDGQTNSISKDLDLYRNIFNGGNNIGKTPEDVKKMKAQCQEQIDRLLKSLVQNGSEKEELALKISDYRKQLVALKNKKGSQATAKAPQTLAQAAQLPTATKQATPEMAAQLLAASKARAA